MTSIALPVLLTALCASTYLLAHLLARFGPQLGLVDLPNHRSSHKTPTPRGGGLSMLTSTLLLAPAGLWMLQYLAPGNVNQPPIPLLATLILSALMGATGLWDDIRGVPPRTRLLLQGLITLACCALLYPMNTQAVPLLGQAPQWLLLPLCGLGLMWWLNLFNFMDGLDGLASSQALHMSLAGLLGLSMSGVWPELPGATHLHTPPEVQMQLQMQAQQASHMLSWLSLGFAVLSASLLGFLIINWHPARIFMGDAGSLSLALMLFMLAMFTINSGALSYPFWLIIGASFVTDATLTLLARMARKAKLSEAHREHTYQRLFDKTKLGQRKVTGLYALFNGVVLLPLGLLALQAPAWADAVLLTSYALTLGIAVWVRKRVG